MMRPAIGTALACAAMFLSAGAVPAIASEAYLRYPDIHGERLVFAAEDDLWLASLSGGASRRLTTHPGTEYFPSFSPDGERIAFTGEYDGNRDLYLIEAGGGEPRRLTWHPGADEVLGWMPDGGSILFRSRRADPNGSWEIFTVPASGGDPRKLPLGWAARLDVDPETGSWAFNRKERERRNWKRYRGGTAPKIWVGHPGRADFRQITEFEGNDTFPMWHGGRIWFLSDQGGTVNIWSVAPDGSDRRRHTDFQGWDARWPAMGPEGRIVFSLAADIYLFDPADGSAREIPIELPSDRTLTRVRYPDPGRSMSWFDLAPEGDRLAVVTRGEIFSVPVEEGVTLPVTHSSGAREAKASFGPEGKRIVYVTDEPREEEIRSIDAWGRGEPTTVKAAGESGWHFAPVYSPDGERIAYADQTQTLFVVPAEGGEPVAVDRSEQSEIRSYVWSPDGRWLAYTKEHENAYGSIFVYDTEEEAVHAVTGATTDDRSPSWDPEGRYLYFLSDRATNPVLGGRDFENVEVRDSRLYMALLREEVENPLAPRAGLPPDEEEGEEAKDEDEGGEKKEKEEEKEGAPEPVEIDLEGIERRVVELPVPRGRYFGLGATAKGVFYVSVPLRGMAEMPGIFEEGDGPSASLHFFDLEKKKSTPFLEGISGYELEAGSGKIAVMKGPGELYVLDAGAPPGPALAESRVSLDGLVVELDPREEWEQIFYEAWRHMRDFYWDEGMGGVDWEAMRDQYATLLPRVATRSDLQDLIGELIAELSTSHTYVFGGDPGRRVPRVSTGLLGADLVREGEAYRVERIYRGDPADLVRSPLDEPGLGVQEGDYLLAVNHRAFPADRSFHAALQGLAGREVVLTVNDSPEREGAREVVTRTLASEAELRYSDWVRRNREYVSERTGGAIGYVHIPDMWKDGLIEFNTWFYPQLDREGMVVDTRWNGGGAVSQMIVSRLARRLVSFNRSRGGRVQTYPFRVLNGPFVVLTNEFAGSDGDIFPQAIQLLGLAPVIGTRSWGGVVGIRGDKPLVDGGLLTEPEFAWWDPREGWSLENRGVVPDIEVQNLPQDLARGVDAQLDRAIAEVLALREAKPPVKPEFGPARNRSREAYAGELEE